MICPSAVTSSSLSGQWSVAARLLCSGSVTRIARGRHKSRNRCRPFDHGLAGSRSLLAAAAFTQASFWRPLFTHRCTWRCESRVWYILEKNVAPARARRPPSPPFFLYRIVASLRGTGLHLRQPPLPVDFDINPGCLQQWQSTLPQCWLSTLEQRAMLSSSHVYRMADRSQGAANSSTPNSKTKAT